MQTLDVEHRWSHRLGSDTDDTEAKVDLVATFEWEGTDVEGQWRLRLKGELDLAEFEAFNAALSERQFNGRSCVLLDLRELTFMDCSGLRAILLAIERAETGGGELKLIRGPRQVHRVFEVTGVMDRLEFVDP